MIIRTRTKVDKDYFIKALAYELYIERLKDLNSLSKKEALKILRTAVWWCGKVGWTGEGNQVTDLLGEFEALDKYEECVEKAEEYVNKKIPNFK